MTKQQEQPAAPARSFEIDAPVLRAALADVADVVEKRNTIPILSNVLMLVTPASLTLTGTDLDAWGERHVTLDGTADPMSLTVEADVLNRIAKKLPADASVRFAYGEGKLTVSAGRSRFWLPTLTMMREAVTGSARPCVLRRRRGPRSPRWRKRSAGSTAWRRTIAS